MQALQFLSRDANDGAVTGCEGALGLGVLHLLEGLQVGALAELVVAAGVAVVHQHPCAVVQAEHAGTLDSLVGVLTPSGLEFPGVSVVKVLRNKLLDALLPATFCFEEDMKESLVVLNDVGVDAGILHVKEELGLAFQVAEILVGLGPIDAVVGAGTIVGEDGEIDDILACDLVIEGLGSPHAGDMLEHRSFVAVGEVHGVMFPVDKVFGAHQYHAAVAAPAQGTLHVCNHHVEPTALAAKDVGIADAAGAGDVLGGDDGLSVVQRCVVPAVLGDGIADLLLFGGIAGEIGEEVRSGLGLGADSAGGQGEHKGKKES